METPGLRKRSTTASVKCKVADQKIAALLEIVYANMLSGLIRFRIDDG